MPRFTARRDERSNSRNIGGRVPAAGVREVGTTISSSRSCYSNPNCYGCSEDEFEAAHLAKNDIMQKRFLRYASYRMTEFSSCIYLLIIITEFSTYFISNTNSGLN